MGQLGRTTAAGDGKHRGSEMAIGVLCSGSDEKRWRTELELGSRRFLDDHHGAATLPGDPPATVFDEGASRGANQIGHLKRRPVHLWVLR